MRAGKRSELSKQNQITSQHQLLSVADTPPTCQSNVPAPPSFLGLPNSLTDAMASEQVAYHSCSLQPRIRGDDNGYYHYIIIVIYNTTGELVSQRTGDHLNCHQWRGMVPSPASHVMESWAAATGERRVVENIAAQLCEWHSAFYPRKEAYRNVFM